MARAEKLVLRRFLRASAVRENRRADLAYAAYCAVLVALIIAAPLVRALWLLLATAEGMAVLMSSETPTYVVAGCLALLALVCAPFAAPAVRRPHVAALLADAPIRYSVSFAGPARWWLGAAIGASVGVTVLVQSVVWAHNPDVLVASLCAVASAAAFAVIAWVCALGAQVSARFALIASLVFLALAVALAIYPFVPVGWLFSLPLGSGLLVLLAITLFAFTPALIERLRPAELVAAAVQRDSIVMGISLMDSAAVTTAATGQQLVGRRWRAVRGPLWLALPLSALVGAARRPVRLVRGLVLVGIGGVVAGFASASPVAAVAAVLMYAGLGAVSDGMRTAADTVRSAPSWGISDARLFGAHVGLPAVAALAASTLGVIGGNVGVAVIVALTAVLGRAFAALTPDAPLELLAPIPTPAGDLSAMFRALWAVQGVLFAGTIAWFVSAAVLAPSTSTITVAAGVAALAVWLSAARWRAR